jgi:hydroxyacylglutathione hydrolase
MLEIVPLVLGLVSTNVYLIADSESGEAAVIDPAWDGKLILDEAKKRGWRITQIWCTHAHFDHIGGVGELARGLTPAPVIALHPADRPLWDAQGGAAFFGISLPPSPAPNLDLVHGLQLQLGVLHFEVRHAPGHTPGLCIFYCADICAERSPEPAEGLRRSAGVCFCGDLIFAGGVGRTDLAGGDWDQLVRSIKTQVYTLSDGTRLLPGHGEETSVGEERLSNQWVAGM